MALSFKWVLTCLGQARKGQQCLCTYGFAGRLNSCSMSVCNSNSTCKDHVGHLSRLLFHCSSLSDVCVQPLESLEVTSPHAQAHLHPVSACVLHGNMLQHRAKKDCAFLPQAAVCSPLVCALRILIRSNTWTKQDHAEC